MPASRPAEIDAGFVGVFGEGFTPQGFPASLVLQSVPGAALQADHALRECLRHRHRPRSTARCDFIAAGRGRFALVVGAEKMTATPGAQGRRHPADRVSYRKTEQDIEGGFAGVFGRIAEAYFQRHGDQSDALAAIAAKNHTQRRGQPLGADAQGPRLRFLPHREREEPLRRARR